MPSHESIADKATLHLFKLHIGRQSKHSNYHPHTTAQLAPHKNKYMYLQDALHTGINIYRFLILISMDSINNLNDLNKSFKKLDLTQILESAKLIKIHLCNLCVGPSNSNTMASHLGRIF